MHRRSSLILLLVFMFVIGAYSQSPSNEVYLITCSPGEETSSIYGHSAIRLVDHQEGTDSVYSWGVFDFNTPNFNFKFARGRLDYMLAAYSYNYFLRDYFNEERTVYLQKVNLSESDINDLKAFLQNNLKSENKYYRYDFFMDNCATRIRDIFEVILEDKLIYPDYSSVSAVSYRQRLDEYQKGMLWLDMGIDLLIGTPGDEECDFRGSMFLPDYLMWNLSKASIRSDSFNGPLLEPVQTVFEFEIDKPDTSLLKQPWFILTLVVILVFFFTFTIKSKVIQGIFDQSFFIVLFFLSFLMIFTNYLTDHMAMGNNYNMVWLNPLLILSPFVIFFKTRFNWLWSLTIALCLIFMIMAIFIKQAINPAFIPVILIIILRSHYRLNLYQK